MTRYMTINANGQTVPLGDQHRRRSVPPFVCSLLDKCEEDVSFLEIRYNSCYLARFLEYCAQVAVDVTEDAPPPIGESDAHANGKVKCIEGKRRTDRLYPGTLTSLRVNHAPIPRFDPRDKEDDSESESEGLAPPILMGLGAARLTHDGKHIVAIHGKVPSEKSKSSDLPPPPPEPRLIMKPPPPPMFMRKPPPPPPKARLTFFAESSELLRTLAKVVITWNKQRKRPSAVAEPDKFALYTLSGSKWRKNGLKNNRKLSSIILRDGQLESIVDDFRQFMVASRWYEYNSLPHRRAYLFHGLPGTGKTSTIVALAGELRLPVCFMLLGDEKSSNTMLKEALQRIPKPSLLVIEDIDALFNDDRTTKNEKSALTFSGLLQALDGLISTDGVITIMTTNFVDRLDPALIRAGRVDRKFHFEPPTRKEVAKLFLNFYPDAPHDDGAEFADKVFGRSEKEARSIATLHQHFIYTRDKEARECIDCVDDFFKRFYADDDDQSASLYA